MFFVTILLVALAGTSACEEQREFEGSPVLTVKVNGQNKTLLRVPMDLRGLEKKLFAMSSEAPDFEVPGAGGGGAPIYASSTNLDFVFYSSSDVVGGPYASSDVAGVGYYPSDATPAYFSGGGTCDFASEACSFVHSICQYVGPVAGSFGGDEDDAAEAMALCAEMSCAQLVAGAEELIDELFPADIKCALATILSCVTPQVPAMAGALSALGPEALENEAALQAALTPVAYQVAACLGPYMTSLEQAFTSYGGEVGSSDDWDDEAYSSSAGWED